MTTFTLVNSEVQVAFSSSNATTNNQPLYTVPAGKIARVDFDSCHWRSTGSFASAAFMVWSKPANVARKHYVGNYQNQAGNTVRSVSFYPAWSDFSNLKLDAGGTTNVWYTGSDSTAQIQNWLASDGTTQPETSLYENTAYTNNATAGARFWGPRSIYLAPNEQMLFFTKCTDNNGLPVNSWINIRLAVWLEDA